MNCTASSIVELAKCFDGIPRHMEMPVLIRLFCEVANMNCDANTLVEGAKCFDGIDPKMHMPILIYLACNIVNGGTGTNGATCLTCSDLAPTDPPSETCSCALHYTKGENPGVWVWDADTNTWEPVIAQG